MQQFEGEVILLCVRWYFKYPLSFRNLKDIMMERGIEVSHTSIMRWTHQYASILENKVRRHLKLTNDSWRVDETYIKIKAEWKYLYRAVDSEGNTVDFLLTSKRDKKAARRFFNKALKSKNNVTPRVITIDKSGANFSTINSLKQENSDVLGNLEVHQNKYLNNIIEQNHRFIKRIVKYSLGFKCFNTAKRILPGIEIINYDKERAGRWIRSKCPFRL